MAEPIDENIGLEYYTAVGHALTELSLLEHALSRLFSICVADGINNVPAIAAFWAVVSFEGKVKMTGAAFLAAAQNDKQL